MREHVYSATTYLIVLVQLIIITKFAFGDIPFCQIVSCASLVSQAILKTWSYLYC